MQNAFKENREKSPNTFSSYDDINFEEKNGNVQRIFTNEQNDKVNSYQHYHAIVGQDKQEHFELLKVKGERLHLKLRLHNIAYIYRLFWYSLNSIKFYHNFI